MESVERINLMIEKMKETRGSGVTDSIFYILFAVIIIDKTKA